MADKTFARARMALTVILTLTIISGAIADLGFIHAGNDAWPPHAKFHALWNVWQIAGTHGLALALLWVDMGLSPRLKIRLAALINLALASGFFISLLSAGFWGASVHPDLPLAEQPPTLLGVDGNLLGFLLSTPIVVWAWRLSVERAKPAT